MKNEPEATPVKVDLFELIAELNHEIAEAHTKYGYEHNALVNVAAKIKEAVAELFGTAEEDELCDCNRCERDYQEKCGMCGEACLPCQDKFADPEE